MKRPSLPRLAIGLMMAGLVLLALGGYLTPWLGRLVQPVLQAQTAVVRYARAVADYLAAPTDVETLRRRNRELEAQVAQLQTQLAILQQQVAELELYAALLDLARAHPEHEYKTAQVIGRDPSPFMHYIIINVGSDDDIRPGMPVVSAQGLAGQVDAVIPRAARVRLITDPASKVNVRVTPANVDALLVGSVTGDLQLRMVPLDAKINVGDLVVTSGLGGQYPPNLLVGQIASTQRLAHALFQEATVQPATDFANLKVVLVITNFRPVDITPLIPTPIGPAP
ncbi:MAG: rod shape-determining protein MreC [Chloroflexi bacterium]|nr:rod shape-determining protein MreC [Chloroflexota bacterium]